ncbi:MAG TPA: alpha/beta fold hydrolase [Bacteroidales bacterium]|nr:alpha/beta fold hydrolase [Bacteroidales bacterium]
MKLFYRHFGSGEPLILLHGVFGMSDNWVTVGRRLGAHFSVFIPDQRNHGHSPHNEAHNYYALADDVLEFMDEHNLQDAAIIGHSMGGKVAMCVALEASHRINKLVIIDISPKQYPVRQEHIGILHAMRSVDLSQLTSRQEAETLFQEYPLSDRMRYFILKNLNRDHAGRFFWRINLGALEANLEGISGSIPIRGSYAGPVLVIRGGDSDYITEADGPFFSFSFPNYRMTTIAGASHWVHADRPEELFTEVMAFLRPGHRQVSTL